MICHVAKKIVNIDNKFLFFLMFVLIPSVISFGQPEFIAISKSGPSNTIPGKMINYMISVGNGDQNEWTGTITDVLPPEFTYYSSSPEADNIIGQTLKWTGFTVSGGQNRVIIITGYAGKPGSTFPDPRYPDGYYMLNSNIVTSITNNASLEYGTSGITLSDSYTTDITQSCDFYFEPIIGQIKMATNATFKYLVMIQNLGNVWDRYSLYVDPDNPEYKNCTNPDSTSSTNNEKLYNQILDLDDNPLNTTPWIAPGKTYSFFLKLTTPQGTAANRWNCTDLIVTSEISEKIQTKTFHTETVNPTNDAKLYLFQIDHPDPISCYDTLSYSIYVTNIGINTAYNTVITENYNSFVEFISSDPQPDTGTVNKWTLGQIPTSSYTMIDVKVKIKDGVYNEQQLINEVIVNYENDAQNPVSYTQNAFATTTVNAYPDLVVEKSVYPNTLKLGDTITYTLNYYNIGCGIGTGVKIEDKYDEAHTTILNDEGGSVGNGKIIWDVGEVSPQDGILSLSYTVKVTDVSCGAVQIQNEVSLSSFEPDQNILNNSSSVSLLATTSPVWTRFPADVTVKCDSVPDVASIGETDDVWATDACGRNVTITYGGENKTIGDCADRYILTRTWKAEDEYGNYIERSQVITVSDNIPSDITCPSFTGYNISVDEFNHISVFFEANSGENYIISGTDFDADASDNCDVSPGKTYSLSGSTSGSGSSLDGKIITRGVTTVTWTTIDRCGNVAECTYSIVINSDPDVTLEKKLLNINSNPDISEYFAVDNLLKYSFSVQNTGNVTLYNVSVTDLFANVTGDPITLVPGAKDSTTFTATYTITQNDIDAGKLYNVATATVKTLGDLNAEVSNDLTVLAAQAGAITLDKISTTTPDTYDKAGVILTYNLVITNTGNVTLTDIVVTDTTATFTGSPVATLAPGASVTITASHTVTQADLDAGRVDNTVGVSGTYHDGSNNGYTVIASDTVTVLATQVGAITLNKISTTTSDTYDQAGDILTYNLVITNTGNVTLTDIVVTDTTATVTGSPVATLAPGASVTITASYTVTQADIDTGEILNIAEVEAIYTDYLYNEHKVTATGVKVIKAYFKPTLAILSTASQSIYNSVGDEITYTIIITNTGNVTIADITVNNDLTEDELTIPHLMPGESDTLVATYVITQDDLEAGILTNSSSVHGLDPNNNTVTFVDSVTILAIQPFSLTVTVTTSPEDYVSVNEKIVYKILLESTSTVNMFNILVTDTLSAHTTYVSSNYGGSYNELTNTVSWNIDLIKPGEIIPLELVVVVDGDTEHEALIENTVLAECNQTGKVVSNLIKITALRSPILLPVSLTMAGCYNENSGSASVEAYGGILPYKFTWNTDPVQTGPTAKKLATGTYKVTVEDAMGFTDELSVTITQPSAGLNAIPNVTNVLCSGESTGAVDLNITGGTEPYAFQWSTNATTQNINGLSKGDYSVTISDANGCTLILETKIEEPSGSLRIFNIDIESVICIDDPFGSIRYDISGGVPPYTYLWNTNKTTMNLEDIVGGNYNLTITDHNGCKLVHDFFVDHKYSDCEIRVPGGLIPNGQFDNILIIRGLERYPNNTLKIFNRYGSQVFEAAPYQNDWDGIPNIGHNITESDGRLPSGTYFYILELETGRDLLSGYIYLIKD